LTGVALILFWPAAFALGGTKGQEAEYGRLKGEYDAIIQQANAKKCSGIQTVPAAASVGKTATVTGTNETRPAVSEK
jgi:hypothetical protein